MHILIRKAIKEKFGRLNQIQIEAFRRIYGEKKSTLIIAPTGSGKTEAAILPVINSILEENLPPISALYIAPLKALNRDLLERLMWWGKRTGVMVDVRHGDTPQSKRARQVRNPPHILIVTPETLPIILTMKSLRPFLRNVKFVIIDEIAELVDNKRGVQLILNLERLRLISDFIRIGLSATVGNEEEIREWLKADVIVRPRLKKKYKFKVLYPRISEEDEKLAERLKIPSDVAARLRTLWNIVENYRRALIFVNTRQFAEVLAHRLKAWGKPVEVHHGSLSRDARIEAEKKLKNGEVKALVCTSSMELGIDIGDVDVVVQYMSPRQVNRLIQRAGRSKHRLSETSEAYIITTSPEDYLESLVIAKRALEGKLEPVRPYMNARDVLAHFVVGLLIEYKEISISEPYRIAKSTYPYKNLSWEDYLEVLRLLEEAGIIKIVEGKLKLGRRSYKYYFDNLSMIPDEISYKVLDVVSGKIIGRLDENFVIELEEGVEFIMHGRSWIVLEIDRDGEIVKVRESGNIEGAIPSWEGELIPVPYEVARDTGVLKRELLYDISRGVKLIEGVEFEDEDIRRVVEELKGSLLSTDRDIVIEVVGKIAIIHASFGNKVNETLARILWVLLSSKYGNIFSMKAYAHAIVIKAPFKLNPQEIADFISVIPPEGIPELVIKGAKFSSIYRWKMINVAKRIGALSKRAKVKSIEKLFEGTIIEKETLNEIFQEKVDIPTSIQIIRSIREGFLRIKTTINEKPSILALPYMNFLGEFLISGPFTEEDLREMFYQKLLEKDIVMVCTNCGWHWRTKVGRVIGRGNVTCPKCGSLMLAPLHPKDAEEFLKVLKKVKNKMRLSAEEERVYLRGLKASDLYRTYGENAVLALATYGVGVKTASRVLASIPRSQLISELMELEKKYIRTRKFWD
ncbi:DEAD/DEAH box helicase [Pyrococcus sp. ST04]|uniref:DEAD/DEAH box helicase n=1 Tax=Pyrococcus sp. ST04 TaxID=1183377 RepID=UPI0002605B1E|nr:DEAD/DEAH box helicase [Pyrococcus sp. ST04]AFK22827.1 putative ATP-dependent helicase [Pyrococcus sp. ST04]